MLLFSGTVFTRGETGFAVEQLSWSLEARCRLPVAVWRELMDHYFPGGGWIRLDRETLDALPLPRRPRPDLLGADARRAAAGARWPAS